MMSSLARQALCVLCLLTFHANVQATSVRIETEVNANADSAQALAPTVDNFRNALGSLNANAPVNANRNGRRQINWDAAPDSISFPNEFPGDFFNFNAEPRARGIEFSPVGGTTSFSLSATAASGQPINFGNLDFSPFSPERLFTPVSGTTFDVKFFDPADQEEPATSRGLGVVFNGVQVQGLTKMVFYDVDDNILAEREVSSGSSQGFSFTGLIFNKAVVATVRITSGNVPFSGQISVGVLQAASSIVERADAVVMDDFIFGEPTPIKKCGFFCKLVNFVGDIVDFFF